MNEFSNAVIPLIIGILLDTLLGDPRWLPHPIRLFGRTITLFEKHLNSGINLKLKGLITTLILTTTTFSIFFLILIKLQHIDYAYMIFSGLFVFYGLANRSLITEALKVKRTLSTSGLTAGRKQLSYIVGRDTEKLSENQIRTAVLETLAENLSDGVIAPLFYYAIGGVPLMMTYKMVNTLDSMIGYKNRRYKNFGFAAAKLDDILNFIPARITALLMVTITLSKRGFKFIFKYGNKHSSPNAGYPEAALAGILNCRFGGPNIYHNKIVEKPYIGTDNREITSKDINKSCVINFVTTISFIIIYILIIYAIIFS